MPQGGPPWAHQHVVRRMISNGPWHLQVARAGKYRISLYRWPPYLNQSIDSTAAAIQIAGINLSSKIKAPSQTSVAKFELTLPAGATKLRTTLTTPSGKKHGAYFATVERIE